jgi:hypothetical protein
MHKYPLGEFKPTVLILSLVVAGVLALFIWQGHTGLSLMDEGFLWYGAQRVMAGEVPIRDFMAYDIGRYYWSAAFMSLMGSKGIVALRVSIAVFAAIALSTGLIVLVRSSAKQHFLFWGIAAITLLTWMSPQYRVFDIALPIVLVGVLAFLVELPSLRRYFLAGLIIGLVAVFGRNHGLYGVVGSLCVMLHLTIKRESGPSLTRAFPFWLLGIVVGYLPVLVFLVVVPGFASAFWESIRFLFELKATNIPLPVPWPWLAPFGQLPTIRLLRGVMMGIFFMSIVIFGVLGIVWVIRKKLQKKPVSATLIAAILLALPYAHYAYSRPDIEHLTPGIIPFLMGILAILASQPARIKWPAVVLFCGAGVWAMLPTYSAWTCQLTQQCVEVKAAGDTLKVERVTARSLAMLNKLEEQYAPGNRTFVVTPFWPGAYAALGRKSPMWENYALFPRSETFQQAEIERIKAANPGFVVVLDFAIDGRDDLRFRITHPIIEQYIRENFVPVYGYDQNPEYQTYRNMQIVQ